MLKQKIKAVISIKPENEKQRKLNLWQLKVEICLSFVLSDVQIILDKGMSPCLHMEIWLNINLLNISVYI